MSLIYFIAIPLLASFLTPFYRNHLRFISVAVNVVLAVMVAAFYGRLPLKESVSFDSPLSIGFVLDQASFIFVALFVGVMLFFSLYSIKEKNSAAIFVVTNIFTAGALGLVLSADIFNIYIFFEIASISAYIFTGLNRDKAAYAGAIKYMIVGAVASIFLLLGIMLIYLNLGYLTLVSIGTDFHTMDKGIQYLILLSFFVGFGIKAEIFPLNFWVVDIYQSTPTKIASLFSAVLSKAYLFVFFHILYTLNIDASSLFFLAAIGLLSFAVAELSALKSKDLKRIFAYSTLGQLGILFLAFSSADTMVISGALFLVLVHSISKLMLFFSLDLVENKMHSTRVEAFSGFKSAFLFTIFAIGFLSLLGIPPFAGFIAKLTILKGFAGMGAYGIIGGILAISLVEATYFFRLLSAHQRSKKTAAIAVPLLPKIMLSLLALSLLYLGLFPQGLLSFCTDAAQILMQGVVHV